jgi:hypothetical protein
MTPRQHAGRAIGSGFFLTDFSRTPIFLHAALFLAVPADGSRAPYIFLYSNTPCATAPSPRRLMEGRSAFAQQQISGQG